MKVFVITAMVMLVIFGFGAYGYVANIVKLCGCDFAVPVKAEVIRMVGVFLPPVGAVAGYCDINDIPSEQP